MHRERIAVIAAILALGYFTVQDVLEDIGRGDGFAQIALDMVVITAIASVLIYIYILEPLRTRIKHKHLTAHSVSQSVELEQLSKTAKKQLRGLGAYMKAQFDDWQLTDAEQSIALLLLKGFSMKEIAQLRDVSERTIRQQATTIYSKADLPGRAGLSAFFLEDLLLPMEVGE